MNSQDLIISTIQNRIDEIIGKYDINFLILFGSVVDDKRDAHFDSDIDIAVSLSKYEPGDYTTNPLVQLSMFFDELLDTDTVQVILWEDLPLHLKFDVYKTGMEIFVKDRNNFRAEMEITMKLFWDYDIWHKNYIKQALENLG